MTEPPTLHRFRHDAMACAFEVALEARDRKYAFDAAEAVFAEIDRLEGELSRFVPSSDVARIARLRDGERLRIGAEAFECLALAAEVGEATAGAFDVTFASAGGGTGDAPRLALDRGSHAVVALVDGVRVDLGGVGKGYALDRAAELLADWGIDVALLHAGASTVLALGAPSGVTSWTVALRDPRSGDPILAETLAPGVRLRDGALSGSGRSLHGAHIVDPRTGSPARGALAAWACAPSAARADALSTAFMILEPAEVEAFVGARPEVSAALALDRGGHVELLTFGKGFTPTPCGGTGEPLG